MRKLAALGFSLVLTIVSGLFSAVTQSGASEAEARLCSFLQRFWLEVSENCHALDWMVKACGVVFVLSLLAFLVSSVWVVVGWLKTRIPKRQPSTFFNDSPAFGSARDRINAVDAFVDVLERSEWSAAHAKDPNDLPRSGRYDTHLSASEQTRARLAALLDKELHDHLRLGELAAWGRPDSDKPVRPIPKEEWDEISIM
jgi:hypothetical protein